MSAAHRALLIIDHGSRNERANQAISEFAGRIAEARSDWRDISVSAAVAWLKLAVAVAEILGLLVCLRDFW